MSGPKCNLPEDERKRILAQFPADLDEEEETEIRDMFPQYLFFRNEYPDDGYNVSSTPVRFCTCTACGETFEAVRGNYPRGKLHHERCNCPNCGRDLEGIAVGKYSYRMTSLATRIKTAVLRVLPDGALQIEAGQAMRRFTHDELVGEIVWRPEKRYYFRRGAVQAWTIRIAEWSCDGNPRDRWDAPKTVPDAFAPAPLADYWGEYTIVGLPHAFGHDAWKYCQMESFYHYQYEADIVQDWTTGQRAEPARYLVWYLAWYALHPTIEMAVRCNLQGAVAELIQDGKKNARLLDWAGRTPAALMRMDKQDARFFFKNGLDFGDLRDWREVSGKTTLTRYFEMVDQAGGKDNARELIAAARAAKVSFGRALHYVKSFRTRCARNQPPMQTVIQVWKDYLSMAGQLGYDLRDETVRMPKDLTDRHDAAAALIRHQASEKEQKRYKKRRAALEKQFAFDMDGYVILVPTCAQEIVEEGKTLHHCVGGYAARHINGSATILFLRRARKQARSYLTIELYEERGVWKLRQIHGYQNECYKHAPKLSARERFAWLLEPWLNWVNSGSPRDRDGKPIVKGHEEVKTA